MLNYQQQQQQGDAQQLSSNSNTPTTPTRQQIATPTTAPTPINNNNSNLNTTKISSSVLAQNQSQMLNKTLFSQFTPFFQWGYVLPGLANATSLAYGQKQNGDAANSPVESPNLQQQKLKSHEDALRQFANLNLLGNTASASNSANSTEPNNGQLLQLSHIDSTTCDNSNTLAHQSIDQQQQQQEANNHVQSTGIITPDDNNNNNNSTIAKPQPVDAKLLEFTDSLLDTILPSLASNVIEDAIYDHFYKLATPHAIEYHAERLKKSKPQATAMPRRSTSTSNLLSKHKKASNTAHAGYDSPSELTDISDDDDDGPMDPLRKVLVKEWKAEMSQFDWRFEWLNLRTKQLQSERDDIEMELQALQQKKVEQVEQDLKSLPLFDHKMLRSRKQQQQQQQQQQPDTALVKRKIISHKVYPPEKRREDIQNNPAFAPFKRSQQTPLAGITRDDVSKALNIFISPERKRAAAAAARNKKRSAARGLSNLAIPATPSDKSKARSKKSKSSSSGNNNKRKATPSSSTNSARRDFSFQEFVVPWNDIRSAAVIEEVKPMEIFTPAWRSADAEKPLDASDEEDTSDAFYAKLHYPLEIDERKKAWQYIEEANEKKKKKKKQPVLNNPETSTPISASTPASAIGSSSSTGKQLDGAFSKSRHKNIVPRYMQVERDSYISAPFPAVNMKYGNWEELKLKDEELEREKQREELAQQLLTTNNPSNGGSSSSHRSRNNMKSQYHNDEEFQDDYLAADSVHASDEEFAPSAWLGEDDEEFYDRVQPATDESDASDFEQSIAAPGASKKRKYTKRKKTGQAAKTSSSKATRKRPNQHSVYEYDDYVEYEQQQPATHLWKFNRRNGPLSLVLRRVPIASS